MIEAMIGLGPGGGFGLGIVNTGGCEFRSSIGLNAFGRIAEKSTDKAISAMAYDAATARSEISGEPIGIYKLLVKEATYRDKATGKMVSGQTLVSPDFADEPVAVWTDAGEFGTGTREEYQRIVDRANLLATTEGEASIFWVSPGEEKDGVITPQRAYLWVKNGGEVTAYSYSLAGSKDTLSKMMVYLGYEEGKKAETLEDQTVIRSGDDLQITHKDVFSAFHDSLSKTELEDLQQFIRQFREDIEIPDDVRAARLAQKKEEYVKEIRETYKNDIKKAIESIASAFIALPRVLDEMQDSGSAHTEVSGKSMDQDRKPVQIQSVHIPQPIETPHQPQEKGSEVNNNDSNDTVLGEQKVHSGSDTYSIRAVPENKKIPLTPLNPEIPSFRVVYTYPDHADKLVDSVIPSKHVVIYARIDTMMDSLESIDPNPTVSLIKQKKGKNHESIVTSSDNVTEQVIFSRTQLDTVNNPVKAGTPRLGYIKSETILPQQDLRPAIPIIVALPALLSNLVRIPVQTAPDNGLRSATNPIITNTHKESSLSVKSTDETNTKSTDELAGLSEEKKLSLLLDAIIVQLLSGQELEDISRLKPEGRIDQVKISGNNSDETLVNILVNFDYSELFPDGDQDLEMPINETIKRIIERTDRLDVIFNDVLEEVDIPEVPIGLEEEVIILGQQYVDLFTWKRNLSPPVDLALKDQSREVPSVNRLSLLLTLYQSESTRQETKQYIALLMFYEIQTALLTNPQDNPAFEEIKNKISFIEPFFQAKLNDLITGIEQIMRNENSERHTSVCASRGYFILFLLSVLSTRRFTGSIIKVKDLIGILRRIEIVGRKSKRYMKSDGQDSYNTVENISINASKNNMQKIMIKTNKQKKSSRFPKTAVIFSYLEVIKLFRYEYPKKY
ncbi:hypothetical protein FJY90_04380 [Candidatus Gottesmanbacteria bacterium]|nr:hypothetical protein [Candidatus Gottesmanbacteria bacterium]